MTLERIIEPEEDREIDQKIAEPVQPEAQEPTDDEIIQFIISFIIEDASRQETRAAVFEKFYEPGLHLKECEQEIDELIDRAYHKELKAAREAEKQATEVVGQIADERNAAQDEADKLLVEKYKNQNLFNNSPISTEDKERAAQIIRRLEKQAEEEAEKEEGFDDDNVEPFPECPIFTGPLTDLAKAFYPSIPKSGVFGPPEALKSQC